MLTRKDYLTGNCTHRQFYAQFVTNALRQAVRQRFGRERLQKAFEANEHFNTIGLSHWDTIALSFRAEHAQLLKAADDHLSLSGGVCIAKEAARQIIEE